MKNKEVLKKYWIILLIVVLIICVIVGFFIINNKKDTNVQPTAKELPLKVDELPVTLNIVNNGGKMVLEATYTNNSKETITRLTLDVQLNDTGEVIEISSNEVINPQQSTTIYATKAPSSEKLEDVEVVKYKISLANGVYMEYDTKLKQYNWS